MYPYLLNTNMNRNISVSAVCQVNYFEMKPVLKHIFVNNKKSLPRNVNKHVQSASHLPLRTWSQLPDEACHLSCELCVQKGLSIIDMFNVMLNFSLQYGHFDVVFLFSSL